MKILLIMFWFNFFQEFRILPRSTKNVEVCDQLQYTKRENKARDHSFVGLGVSTELVL
jgi:hypothetical protein